MYKIKLTISLLVIFLFVSSEMAIAQDVACPQISYGANGEVIFTFYSDPGFNICAIGTGTSLPPTTIYTGSGSFTSPTVYVLENATPVFPNPLTGFLFIDFCGTGFIACEYDNGVFVCPPVVSLYSTIPSGLYQAGNDIYAGGFIPASSTVEFKAGQNIYLENGFGMGAGVNFSANIEPCN